MWTGKLLIATATLLGLVGGASAQTTLNIASYGGALDKGIEKAVEPWAKKNNIQLRFMPNTTGNNAAKLIATKDKPEFDVILLEDVIFMSDMSKRGVLATFDEKDLPNLVDVPKNGQFPTKNGVPIGFYAIGLFYDAKEFKANNWPVPTSWSDVFRQEYCKRSGMSATTASYTTNFLIFLANFKLDKVPDSIKMMAQHKNCFPTLEASSAKLEEKILLNEYVIGVSSTVRILPLIASGKPLGFIIPKEGTALAASTAHAVKGTGKEKLALGFLNQIISPEAQKVLMENLYYYPANVKVKVTQALMDRGMPSAEVFNKMKYLDHDAIGDQRKAWARDLDRAMTQ